MNEGEREDCLIMEPARQGLGAPQLSMDILALSSPAGELQSESLCESWP